MEETIKLPEVGQIGIVVRDLEKTVDYYLSTFGIGPFKIVEVEYYEATFHGRPGPLKIRIGLARMGQVTLELIEPPEGEGTHREFLENRGEGLHHLGFYVPDVDSEAAKFQEQGIEVIQRGRRVGGGYAYMDTEKVGGVIFELIERAPRPPSSSA